MKRQGSITIFLSFSLLCIFALISVMLEQTRLAGSRYYFQVAVNASLDTLFSQYHRELWRKYRILGLPYETDADLIRRTEAYVGHYLDVENWYPLELEYVGVDRCDVLTEQGGDYLVREILDYMSYGVWDFLELVPEDGEQLWRDMTEAVSAGTMTDTYDGQEREVRNLEKAVNKLLDCVQSQESKAEDIQDALSADDPGQFYKRAAEFRKEARKMDSLVSAYERRAEQLKDIVGRGENLWEAEAENFQQNREQLFQEQLNPYKDYVEEDGRRYAEILNQQEKTNRNLALLQETEEMVEQLEEEYETRLREAEQAAEDGETLDVEELSLASAAELWTAYASTELQLQRQDGDEEKRGFLEQVRNLAQGNLMKLVIPENMAISKERLPAGMMAPDFVSGESTEKKNIVEQVLINEYCGEFFLNALSEEKRQVQYELEYLLQGQDTDRENLQAALEQIFLIRQGLNLMHILSDGVKREEVNALAGVVAGVTGFAPLMEITVCFIMVVWSMGEAVMDLRTLMGGDQVPLWKSAKDWQLSLEGLLNMGQESRCPEVEVPGTVAGNDEKRGFSYEGYLKLLLLLEDNDLQQERMLRVIQMNLQREEPEFALGACVYQVDIRGKACGKHVFFGLPIVENFIQGEQRYMLEAQAQKRY